MLVIENCNSLSELRQKFIDGEEVRTARDKPCEDAISRQAVLEAVKKNTFRLTFAEEQGYEGHVAWSAEAVYSDVIEGALLELPSVNPQPKTGHWIPVSEELPDKEGHYLCSVRYMYPPYNFFEPEKVKYMDDVTIQKFDGEFNIEVKAWMPLPPCYDPQEGSEE
jgi:hypothetical protein